MSISKRPYNPLANCPKGHDLWDLSGKKAADQSLKVPPIKQTTEGSLGGYQMGQATTLNGLLAIRAENESYIDTISDNMGSALALKNGVGDPSILIFVPRKSKTLRITFLAGTPA